MQRALDAMQTARAPAEFGAAAFTHLETLVSYGQRHAGTIGWTKAVKYIAEELRAMGLEPKIERWTDPIEGITFTNVEARIQGATDQEILVGCHHDTKIMSGHPEERHNFEFVGANDSASGVGAVLELARWLKTREPLPVSYRVVFFDGEESLEFDWNNDRALFGSKRWVELYKDRRKRGDGFEVVSLLLLDMVAGKTLQIDDDTFSTPALRTLAKRAVLLTGHGQYFFRNAQGATDDHIPFLDAGIPSLDLIELATNHEWHTENDDLDSVAPESMQIVADVVCTLLPGIEDLFGKRGGS